MKGLFCSLWAQMCFSSVEAKNVEQESNYIVAAKVWVFGIVWCSASHHKSLIVLTVKLCDVIGVSR